MQGLIRIAGGTSVILLSSLVTLSRGVASDYPLLRGRTRPFPGRAFREQRGLSGHPIAALDPPPPPPVQYPLLWLTPWLSGSFFLLSW